MTSWPLKPLVDAADIVNDRVGAFAGVRQYVSTGDVDGTIIVRSEPVTFDSRPSRADLSAAENDVLFARMQATDKVVVVTNDTRKNLWSTGFAALRPRPHTHPRWLSFWVQSKPFTERKDAICNGATQKAITNDGIRKLTIPLAPLAEQARIVRILDEAEALRRLRSKADQATEALVSSLFDSMFGDPISNPKGVQVVRLADLTTKITDGVHLRPDYTGTGIPFISVKNITTGILKFDDCKYISPADHERFTKRCKPEYLDVLYTKVGATYGRAALVDTEREFSIYVSVCLIKPNKELIEPQFLAAAMNTAAVKRQADQRIKGIGVPDLHLDQIREFLLPMPHIDHQRRFANRVCEIRELEAAQANSRKRLDDLFQSLLHRAFQGAL